MFKKRQLGCLAPDPTDIRDYQLAEIQSTNVELPDTYLLIDKMSEVGYQNYGSCSSWGSTAVAEYLNNIEYSQTLNLSEKFVYHNTKKISGLWNVQGDYGRNALKAICKYGAPLLAIYPDKARISWEKYVKEEPDKEVYKKALKYKGKSYWRVGKNLEDFRQAIYQQKAPVAFGMHWAKSYNKPAKDGRLPLPDKKIGGHWVCCVGWDNEKLWVRNSWSKYWGKNGYFYIPFDEFNKHEIWDCWVLLDKERPKPKIETGWVADSWLAITEFDKGDSVTPTYNLNLRTQPWGSVIETLSPNNILEILGESKKTENLTWQKVKKIKK